MKTKHSIIENFKFAFAGIHIGLKRGRNIKIMFGMGIGAILLGIFTRISMDEWAVLVLVIGLVLGLETLNTALEAVVDLVSPDYNEKAKIAKDMAAGAVLIASIASIVLGLFIFLPKIFF